ncbi:MAG: iron ABC transporter permease [Planctomycetaceae bacterium]|nr:iron ABC transporter permease [Planctomycetales bacterium]MCB9926910.1 iron ABC transporter permease [Planctomycetaceae bacterium]
MATLLLLDTRAWLLIRNTALLSGGAVLIAVPTGAILAFLLLRTNLTGRAALLVLFGSMLFVPLYLQAAGWDAGFGKQGWYSFAHGSVSTPILDGWQAAIWIHGVAAIPWVLLISGTGLWLVEPELEEAAILDTSSLNVFLSVTVSRMLPFLSAAALWIFVTVGTEMTVSDLYQVRTFAEEIYIDVPFAGTINTLEPKRPTGISTALIVSSFVALTLLLVSRLVPPEHFPSYARRRVFSLGRRHWLITWGIAALVLVLIGVPMLNVAYKAGLIVEQVGSQRLRHWSPASFLQIVVGSPQQFREEHGWTLLIASLAATASLVLGALLGWSARRGRLRALPAVAITAICLGIPGPMIGLSVIWLLNRDGSDLLVWLYDRTIFAPWLAMLIKALPISIMMMWYAFRTISDELLEHASSEGAGRVTRFLRFGLAFRWRPAAATWLAAFAIASGDLAASILVVPPGITTIPVRVFGLLHSGVDDQVAGICLTTVWGFAAIGGLLLWLLRPAQRRLG